MSINTTRKAEATMKHFGARLLAASLLPFLLAPAAETFAQDQSDLALEEIIVTARKREESLLDTPISITAFTGEALDRVQVDRLDGIAQSTPNLVFDSGSIFSGSNAAAAVFIRGVGQIDYTAEPGVGIYLDGVYIGTSIGSVLDLTDIERVEVLRGPQGTLFGRNTIGGAISVTSVKPDETRHGDLKVTMGSYDRIDARGRINIPISDTLFANFSAATLNRDGFVDSPNAQSGDTLGDVNREALRGALRFVPNDRFEADFSVDYSRARENGTPNILVGVYDGATLAFIASLANPNSPTYVPPPAPLPGPSSVDLHNLVSTIPFGLNGGIAGLFPGVVPNPVFGQPTIGAADVVDIDGHLVNLSNLDLSSDTETLGFALTLGYDFDWATFKSISSYREMDAFGGFDNDATPIITGEVANDLAHDQFSQEFQLSGVGVDDRLNWLLGAYYYYEEELFNFSQVEFASLHLASDGINDNHSLAGFGQVSFDVTEKFSVTGGLRYTDETKKFVIPDTCFDLPKGPLTRLDGTTVTCARMQSIIDPKFLNPGFLAFSSAPVFPAPGGRFCCLPISDPNGNIVGLIPGLTNDMELLPRGTWKSTNSDWTPHLNFAYRWTDDLMTYLTYSEGFKSGGFSTRVFPPRTGAPTFDSETVEVYEIGFKLSGFEDRMRLSGAAFHTQYDDLQIQVTDIAPVIRNAGAAKIDGFELELSAVPGAGWLIQAGVGYLDARYTDLDQAQNLVTDLIVLTEDSALANAPEWSTNLGVQYSFEFPNVGGELITRVDWSYRSEIYNDALNFPQLRQPGLDLVDLYMTYVAASDRWEVSVFGKNITDERYITSGFANILLGGWVNAQLGRPREWGASLTWRFGN